MSGSGGIKKIFAVPHFHYDVEWWKTEDGYNEDVAEILEKAFEMLESNPGFTYTIDQALALKPYWDKRPGMHERIRRYVREGRLEMVGGTWCSPDENIPTGEALARQYVYGGRFFEGEVGCEVETAWEVDAFGHPAQFPQIMGGAGMKGYVFSRGVQNWRDPSEPIHFYWEAPDGTRVLTNWFAAHYVAFASFGGSVPGGYRAFGAEMKGRMAYESRRTDCDILMFPFGSDFTVPTEEWLTLVDKWNGDGGPGVAFSRPKDFFAALEKEHGKNLPTVRGEMNPMLTGCYETREKVKKQCREAQYAILDAEKWCSLATSLGGMEYPRAGLDRAWELILENDFHDIVCGTGTDKVYRNTLKRYAEAAEHTREAGARAKAFLAAEMADAGGGGAPVAVFNSLNWRRNEMVKIPMADLGKKNVNGGGFVVKGPDGKPVNCQLQDGNLLFTADVPAMGFSVYTVEEGPKKSAGKPGVKVNGMFAENEYLRITMDPRTGGLASIYDKELDREMLDTSRRQGNEILMEEDAGNLWTVQKTGREWNSRKRRSEVSVIEAGPLRAGFEARTAMKEMDVTRRVYITAGSRRVEFETEVDFKGKDRRVKAVFDTPFSGRPVFETPYYAQPREPGHHCAQNWVDISNGRRGLAVINSGNPGTDADVNSIGLVLFRSVSVFSGAFLRFLAKDWKEILKMGREAAGFASQGLAASLSEWAFYDAHGIFLREWSSEGGPPMKGFTLADHLVPWLLWPRESDCWERGRHSFRYAVYPHAGDWRSAHLPRRGWEFNTPLSPVVIREGGAGKKGKTASLFSTGADESGILSALKLSEKNDAVLAARVYDSLGKGGSLKLRIGENAGGAVSKTNLVEKIKGKALAGTKTGATAKLRPWEIATYLMDI